MNSLSGRVRLPAIGGCVLAALLFGGCTAKQYKQQADNEVYGIIQHVENQIFGHTNQFDIATKWSSQDPDSILAGEIVRERMITNQLHLSVEDALNLAATQSRRYQTEKEQLYLTALTLTGEQYEFGPQFFANGAGNYVSPVTGTPFSTFNSRAGVSQFLKTGGSLSLNLANDILRYYTGDPRQTTLSSMSINFFQPLLRGFGKNNPAVERLTQSERNVIYEIRSYSYFQNEFAIEIVNDYFTLLGQKNIIRNNYSNYVSQVQSTKRLEERSKDRETINQVDLARQSELTAKNSYVNSIASYFNNLDTFKIKLSIPVGTRVFLDDGELDQLSEIGLIPLDIDKERAFKLATEKNYNILNSIDRFEDAKRKIHVAANQLKADLNIFGDASVVNSDNQDYTSFSIDDVRYNVGFEIDLPIDRLRERNNYRATLISFESQIRTLALDLDSLKDQIDRGVRTLEQRRQNYIIQQNALQLANRRVLSIQLRQQVGLAEVRDLVDAQNDQIAAQNSVVAALVDYQNERLRLLLNIGIVETGQRGFWFKSQIEQAPEILAADYAPLDLPRDGIIPPDQVFSN